MLLATRALVLTIYIGVPSDVSTSVSATHISTTVFDIFPRSSSCTHLLSVAKKFDNFLCLMYIYYISIELRYKGICFVLYNCLYILGNRK